MITGMSVATPELIYAWPKTRDEFDRINLPATIHAWSECSTTTIIEDTGKKWETRTISKTVGRHDAGTVTVVFQWIEKRELSA